MSLALTSTLLAACGYGSSGTPTGNSTGNGTGSGGHVTSTGGTNGTGTGGSNSGAGGDPGTGTGGAAGGTVVTGTGGVSTTGTGGGRGGTGGSVVTGAGGSASAGTSGNAGTIGTTGSGGTMAASDWGTPVAGGPSGTGVTATVTVNTGTTVGEVGPKFVGFSYEKTHITNASLTSSNHKLIGLYKLLGTPTVRLGANDVDQSNYGGTGSAPSAPSGQPFTHTVVSGMIDQFCGFLQATGSQSIYGVNYQGGNVSQSTAEATYVMNKCASNIWGIELGNEIDKYGSWSAQKQKWETLVTALNNIPGVSIIGAAEELSADTSFTAPFTADEAMKFGNKLRVITNHYYNAGANTSGATASTLQNLKSIITSIADNVNNAAVKAKVPDGWRYGEANTFWGHGQMGVSDTIIAALWSLDFMYLTAEHGGNGVDWHGGEVGQDGTRPFYYAAVAESGGQVTGVQPLFYGLLMFATAGNGSVLSTAVTSSNSNFTAYAVKGSGFKSVVLVNRNATQGVTATVNVGAPVTSASAIYLQGTPAGSLSAGAGQVTLAGSTVTTDGVWNRGAPFTQATSGNTATVYVPPVTAALVRIVP
ncbi:MAG: hypothetical protein ACJ8F1_13120 [Polyangia bacterium]